MPKTTLAAMYQPLMGKPSHKAPFCSICGRIDPLEQHHIVKRSAGKMYDDAGHELEKPTITLCGFGNHGADADGLPYCHGLAHANRLHFRWAETITKPKGNGDYSLLGGHWEYLLLDEPTDYLTALEMDGWKRL